MRRAYNPRQHGYVTNSLHSFNQWGFIAQFFMLVLVLLFGPFMWLFSAPYLWKNAMSNFWWSIVLMATGYGMFIPGSFRVTPSLGLSLFGILLIMAGAVVLFIGIYRSPPMLTTKIPTPIINEMKSQTKTAKEAGIEFEEDVARMFRLYGYNVQMTEETGDHGIDLRISKPPEYAVVQCKFYKERIGEPTLRDFYGAMVSDGAPVGYFITTSDFTEQARQWVKGKKIVLIDGKTLRKMQQESKIVANRLI